MTYKSNYSAGYNTWENNYLQPRNESEYLRNDLYDQLVKISQSSPGGEYITK